MDLSTSQKFNLSTKAKDLIEAFVIQHRTELLNRAGNTKGIEEVLTREGHKLPVYLLDAVQGLKEESESMFLLKNTSVVPIGNDIPDTPAGPHEVTEEQKQLLLYAPTMALLNGLLNLKPQRETSGQLRFSQVIPTGPDAEREVFATNRPLSPHIDGMAHINVPDVGALACIKGQKNTKTFFMDVDAILSTLDKETISALKEPNFGFDGLLDLRTGSPFGEHSPDYIQLPYSIIDDNVLRYSQRSSGQTDDADKALEKIRTAIDNAQSIDVELEAGDIFFWNNKKYIHGRSPYEYKEAPDIASNRWVVRQMTFTLPPQSGNYQMNLPIN